MIPDAGVSVERTSLAWRRTVLSAAVVAALTARMAAIDGHPLLAAVALAGWAAMFAVAYRRLRRHALPAGRSLPLFALATLGYAVLGAALVLS
ncbi:DUF202 domain-containing protein [Actinomycetes bacterium KLBMP 9797]